MECNYILFAYYAPQQLTIAGVIELGNNVHPTFISVERFLSFHPSG